MGHCSDGCVCAGYIYIYIHINKNIYMEGRFCGLFHIPSGCFEVQWYFCRRSSKHFHRQGMFCGPPSKLTLSVKHIHRDQWFRRHERIKYFILFRPRNQHYLWSIYTGISGFDDIRACETLRVQATWSSKWSERDALRTCFTCS